MNKSESISLIDYIHNTTMQCFRIPARSQTFSILAVFYDAGAGSKDTSSGNPVSDKRQKCMVFRRIWSNSK